MNGRRIHPWTRWIAGLLAVLLVFLGTGGALAVSAAPKPHVLRVAFPISRGISEYDQYGNRKGLLVDYLNEIAKYTGWEYEYIEADDEELIPDFQAGKYDLMGGTFYAPGFEKYFAYPQYNTGRSRAVLLCRQDDTSLRGYDLNTLNGKTIGVYEKATEKIRYLKEYLASNDLTCEIRPYSNAEMDENGTMYQLLRSGEVDLILGNEMEADGEFRLMASFSSQPYFIVTTLEDEEILEGLNTALRYILESNPDFAEETYDANFPDTKLADIQLNQEELRYIAEKKTLSIAVVRKWHPLNCIDSPVDTHEGLIPDLIRPISGFTGMEFTYVYTDTYADALQLVQDGEVDILGAYMDTDEQGLLEGLVLSRPYIGLSNIVLKNKSVSYPGTNLICGTLKGRVLPSDIEASEIRGYSTPREMIEAVNNGEVDFIYGLSATLEQEMQYHRYLNVVPVSRVNGTTDVSFAISRPVEPELLTILNKAIGSLSTDQKDIMLEQNLVSVGYTNLTFQELVYANPVAFLAIFGAVFLLIMVVILIIARTKVKNSLMQNELRAAQAKSIAKSEFLSRMSHEIRTPMNAIMGLSDLTWMERDKPQQVEKNLQKIRSSSQYLLALINDILDMSRIENGKMEIEQENFSLTAMLDALEEMMGAQADQKGLVFYGSKEIVHEWLMGDSIRLRQVLTNLLSNAMKFTPTGGKVTLHVQEIGCDEQSATYHFSVCDNGSGISQEDQERIFNSFEQLGTSTARSAGTGLGLPISRNIVQLMGGDLAVKSEIGKGSEFFMTLQFPLGEEERSSDESCASSPQRSLQGIRVLLAEDNDLNAEIAQELLALQGVEVRRAVDGLDAVECFTASEPGEYQVILMDIRMPRMDGQQAAREIRASGRVDANIPIIAMTANSFKEDEDAAKAAGMNGFVPKPVEPEYLFSVLRSSL